MSRNVWRVRGQEKDAGDSPKGSVGGKRQNGLDGRLLPRKGVYIAGTKVAEGMTTTPGAHRVRDG